MTSSVQFVANTQNLFANIDDSDKSKSKSEDKLYLINVQNKPWTLNRDGTPFTGVPVKISWPEKIKNLASPSAESAHRTIAFPGNKVASLPAAFENRVSQARTPAMTALMKKEASPGYSLPPCAVAKDDFNPCKMDGNKKPHYPPTPLNRFGNYFQGFDASAYSSNEVKIKLAERMPKVEYIPDEESDDEELEQHLMDLDHFLSDVDKRNAHLAAYQQAAKLQYTQAMQAIEREEEYAGKSGQETEDAQERNAAIKSLNPNYYRIAFDTDSD